MKDIINFIKNKKIFIYSIILISFLFTIDIWTKRYAFKSVNKIMYKTLGVHSYIPVTKYFNIVKVINTGISFGFLNNLIYGQYILSFIVFVIVSFLIYLLSKSKDYYNSFVYSIIIAGGLGNLYDRIIFGGVFDFLDFHIGEYHWPAFNIADSLICIGVFLIAIRDLIRYVKSKKS